MRVFENGNEGLLMWIGKITELEQKVVRCSVVVRSALCRVVAKTANNGKTLTLFSLSVSKFSGNDVILLQKDIYASEVSKILQVCIASVID